MMVVMLLGRLAGPLLALEAEGRRETEGEEASLETLLVRDRHATSDSHI